MGQRIMIHNIILIIVVTILITATQVMLKIALQQIGSITNFREFLLIQLWSIIFSKYFLAMIAGMAIAAIIWFFVVSRAQLSLVYPLLSMSYVWMMFVSWRVFNEPITVNKVVGTLVICLGVIILSLRGGTSR
ncbi:EamA family transporter [bacterium]|nr:EamA family transporter [bacterium]MCK4597634.1 EamA family transporter [bacterium]